MQDDAMYSDKLMNLFKSSGVEIGDRIAVDTKGKTFEGELMPKTEVGDQNTLILKLDNGYNVGLEAGAGMRIKKVAAGKPPGALPSAAPKKRADLENVTLIYTGGTIGTKVDYKTGGVAMIMKSGELLYSVPELANIANVTVKTAFSIASEDLTPMDIQKLAKETASALNGGAHGIVITMGTDVMHYVSAALSFMLQDLDAPVVITGAQRSGDRGSSDAFMNLLCATQLAAKSDIAEVGICMHAGSGDDRCAFDRGTKVRKLHTSRRDAFKAVNDKPMAFVDSKLNITYNSQYKKVSGQRKKATLKDGFETKVALVKTYPGSNPEIIDFYVGKGYKGIVLEGTGLGHAPVSTEHKDYLWLPHIEYAMAKGLIVGMTSQCLFGRVHPNVYRNLRILSNAGVVYCEDMLPETTYIKLGWLLGNYKKEEAKRLLSQNLVGEISSRTLYDEFDVE